MLFNKYWLVYLLWAWAIGCFAYGFIFYSDAPLHQNTPQQPCPVGAFCGKTGKPHTKEEYEAFLVWQEILGPSMAIAIFSMILAKGSKALCGGHGESLFKTDDE